MRFASSGRSAMAILLLTAIAPVTPASANNYGESRAWQFRTSADRVNSAAILDMIERRKAGYYSAPVYNTTIDHQYNCSIAPTATGNSDAQTALANSPSVSGAIASATGNASETGGAGRSGTSSETEQANDGAISASIIGSTWASGSGSAHQALNSSQSNSGDQSASVAASSACTFGMRN